MEWQNKGETYKLLIKGYLLKLHAMDASIGGSSERRGGED